MTSSILNLARAVLASSILSVAHHCAEQFPESICRLHHATCKSGTKLVPLILMSHCLIALRIAPSEPVMPVFFSVLVQYQTFLIAVKQMHVVDSLGNGFLLGATFWLDEFA